MGGMSSGVEFCWGAFSVPPHGLALSVGYGGGLGGSSPLLHLALWSRGPCGCLQGFLMRTLGILEKQSIHHTSFLNKSWHSSGPYQTQFILTSYQADLKNLNE